MNIAPISGLKATCIKIFQKLFLLFLSSGSVLSGPFKGMRCIGESYMSAYYPKLLGTYEKELWEVINEIIKRSPKTIINIGAAEGYYSIGLARLLKNSNVISFEVSSKAQKMHSKMASINNVEERIKMFGECSIDSLNKVLLSNDNALLIVDIEGGEDTLLDPNKIEGLKLATILVEIHEKQDSSLPDRLKDRFKETHLLKEIISIERTYKDLPFAFPKSLWDTFIGRSTKLLMNEERGDGNRWFFLTTKSQFTGAE